MFQKFIRFLTSLLPVAANRVGGCNGCGDCCKLPYECPFLKTRADNTYYCGVYLLRPPSCRKYPRVETEFITPENCGFSFINLDDEPEIIATSQSPKVVNENVKDAA